MNPILEHMEKHHRHCDDKLASAEENIHNNHWDKAKENFGSFAFLTRLHFDVEEGILFPQLEAHMGHGGGPVAVMKQEHEWIRQQLDEMEKAVQHQDRSTFFKHSETCHLLLQQHNMKEEQILYPMSDQILGDHAESILLQMVHKLGPYG